MSQKEKKLVERKYELFSKNVADEFTDTYNKVRQFFTSKLEKNLRRVCEKTSMGKMSAEDF